MSETETDMDISPDVQGSIASTRSRRIEWVYVLGELIDNAFDAGATVVEIDISTKDLMVTDNGNGCGDFEAMLTMGKHTRQKTTRLGRYGVGLKDAAWWVGGPTRIASTFNGKTRTITIPWDSLKQWRIPRPFEQESEGKRGTQIRFERIDRRFPEGKQFTDLVSEIGYIYTPAIKGGRQIIFRRGKSAPVFAERFALPTMEHVVDTSIVVDGKRVRVHVGCVTGDNPRPGINYVHDFRVIIPSTALGCGGYGSSGLAGWVTLCEGWALTRNKDDISLHKEELGDAVFGAIREVVMRASQRSMTLQSASLAANLTAAFRGLVGGDKEKRDPKANNSGRVEPKNTGRKRRNFTKTQPGSDSSISAGKMTIQFGHVPGDAIGRVDLDGGVITLADNNTFIAACKKAENDQALLGIAVSMFANRDTDAPQSSLPIVRDGTVARSAEQITGRLLSEFTVGDLTIKRTA